MSEFLDELARAVARPMPRSRALRLVGGALVSAAVPSLRPRLAWGAPKRALDECDAPGRCAGKTTCGIKDPKAGPSPIPVCIVACCDADTPNCCKWPGYEGPIKSTPGLGTCGQAPYGTVCCCAPGYSCGSSPATGACIGTRDCKGPSNHIDSVKTSSGRDYGLTDTSFRVGQVITASEAMQLQLGDGSSLKLDKGTAFKIDKCPFEETTVIDLLTGRLWTTIKKAATGGQTFEVTTQWVDAGPRGTTFWISYARARKRTTLHVIKGSVEMKQRFGARRKLLVRAGQTAVQQGRTGRPRLIKR